MSSNSSTVTTVPHIRNTKSRIRSGAAAYARAARRYNIESPVFVGRDGRVFKRATPIKDAHTKPHRGHPHHHSNTPGQSGDMGPATEVPAEDIQNDSEYVVPVTIGTPGVTLHLDFDTGSSDLWVFGPGLQGKDPGTAVYKPSDSSTAKPIVGAKWSITYGDNSSASGTVVSDTIKIGSIRIPLQAIELADKVSEAFSTAGSQGLLGLAWPSINTVTPSKVLTPVANIIQHDIAKGIFSVALDKGDNKGFYTFGGIDPARAGVAESEITFIHADNSKGFWMCESECTVVNDKPISQTGNTAILDTGTTLALVSDAVANAIYAAIPGAVMDQQQGGWVYPTNAKIPTVSFAVGNKQYTVNAADFAFAGAGNGMTFGGIQSRGNFPFDILGDVFLKGVYVVFDETNVQIGIAQRSGNVSS